MATQGVSADITINVLEAGGHGTFGTDLFCDDMPADPDDLISVWEYTGPPPLWLRDGDTPGLEYPRLQLTVRGTTYADVRSRAEAVHAALLSVVGMEIEGISYGSIRNVNSGWLKTWDDRNRRLWQRNYEVQREAVTATI